MFFKLLLEYYFKDIMNIVCMSYNWRIFGRIVMVKEVREMGNNIYFWGKELELGKGWEGNLVFFVIFFRLNVFV